MIDKTELEKLIEDERKEDARLTNLDEQEERDPDLEERRGGFRGVSRRNDAWDMEGSDYC